MGRPKDKFCWDYVDRLPDGKLSCKFCGKEFKGGASRIRRHLSGEGGDIGPCDEVPSDIQGDALKESVMKRRRSMLLEEENRRVDVSERAEVTSYAPYDVAMTSANNNLNVTPHFQFSPFTCLGDVNVIERGEMMEDVDANVMASSTSASFDVIAAFLGESPSPSFNDVNAFERKDKAVAAMTTQEENGLNGAIAFQVPSSSYLNDSNKGKEEEVADVLVKFSMSNNVPVDIINNSHFRTLLRAIDKHGVPPCLLQDDSTIIRKSLWNFEQDLNQRMLMVKDSWKTTGCTLMVCNLNDQGKRDKAVLGFYCPKGFIFVEIEVSSNSCETMIKAMKDHVLNLSMDDVVKHIYHDPCISTCPYQARQSAQRRLDGFDLVDKEMHDLCLRSKIQQFCSEICQCSDLVQDLIKKSKKLYKFYVQLSRRQERVEQVFEGDCGSSISRLRLVMELKQELRRLRHAEHRCFKIDSQVIEIIKDKKFWSDGEELLKALTPLLKISDLMDTLVPTTGYLHMAINKAKCALRTYCEQNVLEHRTIRECLENWSKESTRFTRQKTAAYLSPTYGLSGMQGNLELSDAVKCDLKSIVGGEERDAIVEELKAYTIKECNPFANIPKFECEEIHPVKLWLKYGEEFPLLQKCVIKLLNQPVSCMCNQVKKHVSQIQGTDNYLIRLNYTMMQEFTNLGDKIYKHIPC